MPTLRHLLVPLTLSCAATLALAQAPAQNAQQRDQAERAACLQGQTGQARDACLKEAAAALAESRRGNLGTPDADLRANALKRCEPLPAADRAACEQRVREGQTSGSVPGGGTLTTHTQTMPASASQPGGSHTHSPHGHGAHAHPAHAASAASHPASAASAASAAR